MKSLAFAVVTGVLFAVGLLLSGMTEPAKVTAFLDITGSWDPTLAFVMGGAILVHAPIVRLMRQRPHPVFDTRFHWPAQQTIDVRLVAGAAIFGVGWGLSGYCPGPALVGLAGAAPAAVVFVAAMLAGIGLVRLMRR
ncbi:MAG TPA: DUF6691 family protein [Kofleriaceae bacterium]|nr:DUF6691 family protein [Kofleriaceae bacterium]